MVQICFLVNIITTKLLKESLINVNFPINKQTSPNTVTNDYCFRLDWKLIEFLISKI